jgi:lipopolysaccharide transport system ATP-binding protein
MNTKMPPAIRVENLSKQYRIGSQGPKNTNLTERLTGGVKGFARKVRRLADPRTISDSENSFWALKDVSFEIQPGEVVGIIGRNGAGKSTLLKILSRIVEPTRGHVEYRGRMGSLLEVGTGFHPELTGRENIYLNGTILGMSKKEIDRKFDEIVEFSEIEAFLDTPVKRYSSGMYVRLAFAVAAHLEPEILIVDEVLAVGDVQFQQKCIRKIQQVHKNGKTILLVSHNIGILKSLCSSCVMLQNGKAVYYKSVNDGIRKHLENTESKHTDGRLDGLERKGNGRSQFTNISIESSGDLESKTLVCGQESTITLTVSHVVKNMSCSITIYDWHGHAIVNFNTNSISMTFDSVLADCSCFVLKIHHTPFLPGKYRVNAALKNTSELLDHIEGIASFEVVEGTIYDRQIRTNDGYGSIAILHSWISPV